jgi:hypothetical protein
MQKGDHAHDMAEMLIDPTSVVRAQFMMDVAMGIYSSFTGFLAAELYTNYDELGNELSKDFHAELEAFIETTISMHRIELAEQEAAEIHGPSAQ